MQSISLFNSFFTTASRKGVSPSFTPEHKRSYTQSLYFSSSNRTSPTKTPDNQPSTPSSAHTDLSTKARVQKAAETLESLLASGIITTDQYNSLKDAQDYQAKESDRHKAKARVFENKMQVARAGQYNAENDLEQVQYDLKETRTDLEGARTDLDTLTKQNRALAKENAKARQEHPENRPSSVKPFIPIRRRSSLASDEGEQSAK